MDNIIFARWATKEEKEKLDNFFIEKNHVKDKFTNDWLSKNGNSFLEMHDNYDDDFFNKRYNEEIQRLRDLNLKYINENIQYFKIKSGEKILCQCGGFLKIVNFNGSEFVGCSNYRNKDVNHSGVYQRQLKDLPSLFEWKEKYIRTKEEYKDNIFSSNYINEIKQINSLPSELKMSILLEFILMNGRQLYNEQAIEHVSKVVKTKTTSKKRENIIDPILKSIFIKAEAQKAIYFKLKDDKRPRMKFPDFIATDGKAIYLFEQKKSQDDADIYQINLYERLINYITRDYPIHKFFIFEEAGDKIFIEDVKCLTITNLKDEFCR